MNSRSALLLMACLVAGIAWIARRTPPASEPEFGLPADSGTAHRDDAPKQPMRGDDAGLLTPNDMTTPSDMSLPSLPSVPSLTGRVFDETTGQGIEGVVLHCMRNPDTGRSKTTYLKVRSDAEGAFRVASMWPGTWIILPLHVRYHRPMTLGTAAHKHESIWDQARRRGLVIDVTRDRAPSPLAMALRQGVLVSGIVLGPKDEPLANAPIRVHADAYPGWNSMPEIGDVLRRRTLVRSDEAGRFSFACFPKGAQEVRLGVSHPHFVGYWTLPISIPHDKELVLRPWAPARILGSVRWSGGAPVVGATVRLPFQEWDLLAQEHEVSSHLEVKTDSHGDFRFERAPPGDFTLIAWPTGIGASRGTQTVGVANGETRTGVVITLNDDHLLRGVLVTAAGAPIPDEKIAAYTMDDPQELIDISRTDAQGRFVVTLNDQRPVSLFLDTVDRHVRLLDNVTPPRHDLRLVSTPTPQTTVTFRVLDPEGRPLKSYQLTGGPLGGTMDYGITPVDGESTLLFRGTPPYHYILRSPGGQGNVMFDDFAAQLEDGIEGRLEIRLSRRATFYGRVVTKDLQPVTGARMFVSEDGEEREISLDENGTFRFQAINPKTEYLRTPRLELPTGHRATNLETLLRPGVFTDIHVAQAGRQVRGRVVTRDEAGASLAGIEIGAILRSTEEGVRDRHLSTTTDDKGRFAFVALPTDVLVLVAASEDSLLSRNLFSDRNERWITAGGEDVEIEVQRGATISGRIEGPGVADLGSALKIHLIRQGHTRRVFFDGEAPTPATPSFKLQGIPAGRYTVMLKHVGSHVVLTQQKDIETGSTDVVLRIPRLDGAITGRLDLSGLQGVQSAQVTLQRGIADRTSAEASKQSGVFRVERLPRDAAYAVMGVVKTDEGTWVGVAFDIRPGTSTDIPLTRAVTIRGRVEGELPDGNGIVGAEHGGLSKFAMVSSDDGSFTIDGLVGGTYTVTLYDQTSKQRGKVKSVKTGIEDLVIRVK